MPSHKHGSTLLIKPVMQAQQAPKDEDSDEGEDGSIIQRLKRMLHLENELRSVRHSLLTVIPCSGTLQKIVWHVALHCYPKLQQWQMGHAELAFAIVF